MVNSHAAAGGRPTLATVAKALGVSAMTVSNAYNRPEKLSPELRDQVMATAAALGYAGPDPVARSLRHGRVGALGVVLGESLAYAFDDPAAIQFLRGLAHACAERGAALQLIPTTGEDADGSSVCQAAVDAFVVFGLPDDHPLVAACARRGLPILTCGGPQLSDHPFVGIDDRAAAYAAAAHLLELGHRDIAVISLPLGTRRHQVRAVNPAQQRRSTFRVARHRLAGYRSACQEVRHDWSGVLVYEVPTNSRRYGREASHEMLRTAPHITAILAMSDELALGTFEAAVAAHRSVPADLSIVGFDDSLDPLAGNPPLTTIHQSLRDQGHVLGRLALTDTPSGITRIEPWRLVERSSTGPAPRRHKRTSPRPRAAR